MKKFFNLFLLLSIPTFLLSQTSEMDSLKQRLYTETKDTSRVHLLNQLSYLYTNSRPDTALALAQEALSLAQKDKYAKGELESFIMIGNIFQVTGNYPKALEMRLDALKKAEVIRDQKMTAIVLGNIGVDYYSQGNYHFAIDYFRESFNLAMHRHEQAQVLLMLTNIGICHMQLNHLDSALIYTKGAYNLAMQQKDPYWKGVTLINLGDTYSKRNENAIAMNQYRLGVPLLLAEADDRGLVEAYLGIAALFQKSGSGDSCLSYAKKALSLAQKGSFTNQVLEAATFLTNYYSVTHNIDSAFAYQSAALAARDSLFSQEKQQEFQRLMINEATRQQQLVQDQLKYKNKVQLFAFLAGFALLIVVTSIVWRNYLQQRKAKTKIEEAYSQLKSTQSQLIQSEKMASLGELTAGIAHEIQNPLNFVNNFSEVNKEIIDEASEEVDKGNIVEVKNMLNDIRENEEKINHHGKRADAIVKSMLQHSRASSGKKEPTDINALADEYLRLSYHGLRAKDKDFNATIETDFDGSIGEIEVVPQDIGRVLLNLYNNAFYAVSARQKAEGESFKPIVKIQTRKVDSKVEVVVKDNGNGIPQNVVNKIFQPFFTTKPTGQGTGLGLSLSYDIIKAHGGEIKVQSKEGEGAEFIIQLLLSNNI